MRIGFLNLLTLLFIILKVAGFITWSWWLVFLPSIISLVVVLGIVVITGGMFIWATRD